MAGREYARRAAPDDLKSFEFAKADGSIRTMHARDGFLSPQDAEDDAALEAAGYAQHDDDVKAIAEREQKALDDEREANQQAALDAAEAQEKAAAKAAEAAAPTGPEPKGESGKGS